MITFEGRCSRLGVRALLGEARSANARTLASSPRTSYFRSHHCP